MQSQKTIKINVRCIPNSIIALSDVLFIAKENVVHSHPKELQNYKMWYYKQYANQVTLVLIWFFRWGSCQSSFQGKT